MIHLDTHVVAWLYDGLSGKLTPRARELIEAEALVISPMVLLELEYLREIERLTVDGATILEDLSTRLGLTVCPASFEQVVRVGLRQDWTRDPFDRLIVAQADLAGAPLLTRDGSIHAHYPRAVWDDAVRE